MDTPGDADLVLVGGGRMGTALVTGLLDGGGVDPERVTVVEASAGQRARWLAPGAPADVHPGLTVTEHLPGRLEGVGVVIAVKPAGVGPLCVALAPARPARVLSIAAGVTLATLEGGLDGGGRAGMPVVFRAMPNTPALVGAGVSGLAAGAAAGADDWAWASALLGAVGAVVRVTEPQLDAVTALSGSGPAYVFLLAEAMVDAGVLAGLSREVASELVTATVAGAGRMLVESGDTPEVLRANVTSPGGTTAAGLAALERRALRAAVSEAVVAAAARSAELGRS